MLAFMIACSDSNIQTESTHSVEPAIDTLVTVQWLGEHLDDPDLVVLDCTVLVEFDENGGFRTVSGRANYASGHIPSAGCSLSG